MKRIKQFFHGKICKYLVRAVPFVLIAAVIFSVAFFPQPKAAEAEAKRIVRVWNVDTFEGGKGSRTAFLKRTARLLEKRHPNLYFMVSSYTAEGANAAYLKGERPDLLSFGVGLSAFAEASLALPYSHGGGTLSGDCLAYPWCRGEYSLYSLSDNFEETGATVVSCGGSNLPQVSAALAGIQGEEVESLSAYVRFLNGEFRYLLGTQRDACRFASRGVQVYAKPLPDYCDLYQYISVLSSEKWDDCLLFINELLSNETQGSLPQIGMSSAIDEQTGFTVSVFSDDAALASLQETARSGGLKNPEKFLKNI